MKLKLLAAIIALLLSCHANAQRKGYWQQKVNYKMSIDVDEKDYQYNGKMTLKYENNSNQNLLKVYFHVYYNAFQPGSMMDYRLQNIVDPDFRMVVNTGTKEQPVFVSKIASLSPNQIGYQKIEKLTYNGQSADFKISGTILEVTLPKPLKAGSTGVFDLDWSAQIPEMIRRTGRNSKENVALSMAQWYPKMAHFDDYGWHLDEYIGREFIAPFGDFDVTINVNKDYVIGASGKLQNPWQVKGYVPKAKVKAKNNKSAWHFVANNIHDFVWAADPNFVVDSVRTKHDVTIYAIYLPKDSITNDNWQKALGLSAKFFDFTGDRFGQYPWPTYSIIQGGDGGMEYGTATLVTGGRDYYSLLGVIFHESAHSWYQQLFAINETIDEWFDEGFTSYIEDLGLLYLTENKTKWQHNPVSQSYKSYLKLVSSGKEEPMSILADYYNSNYAYGVSAYSKGSVLIAQLGYIIGEENLEKTFLKFYDLWKFKHPTPNDFKRVAEEVSGINLKWYFNMFINTTRKIDYSVSQPNKNEIVLTNSGGIAMPIDLLVEYEDGTKELFYIPLREMHAQKPAEKFVCYKDVKRSVLEEWFWTKPSYKILLSKPATHVTIDPTGRLANTSILKEITN